MVTKAAPADDFVLADDELPEAVLVDAFDVVVDPTTMVWTRHPYSFHQPPIVRNVVHRDRLEPIDWFGYHPTSLPTN